MAVSRSIHVPSADEFQAAFGCDCTLDEDLVQTCIFQDSLKQEMRLTFGHVDGTFGLSLSGDGEETIRIYDEFLSEVMIDEETQTIRIRMDHRSVSQIAELKMWPQFQISVIAMMHDSFD